MRRRPFIAGNWKMHTLPEEAKALALAVRNGLAGFDGADVAICPPYLCIQAAAQVIEGSAILLGAQNVFWEASGAFTGEVSPQMLLAAGCRLTIVGHSERRQYFGETDETVNKRTQAALNVGLQVIVCVGETLNEREQEITTEVVQRQMAGGLAGLTVEQMSRVTIAYEPVWAIGTGKTATPQQAQEVHSYIRALLKKQFGVAVADSVRIQYGGSVKAGNARELLMQDDIDGALVGGASLKADEFVAIVKSV